MHAALTVNLSFDDAEISGRFRRAEEPKDLKLLKADVPQFHESVLPGEAVEIVEGSVPRFHERKSEAVEPVFCEHIVEGR